MSTSLGSASLEGRVAVVTGAGGGLGRAEAIGLAGNGATVIVNDLGSSLERSDVVDVITSAGGRAVPVAGDISDSATATEIMRTAVEDLGSLDIVVNNAGITRDKMLFNLTDEDWDLVVAVHLRGHFLLTRNAAAHWRALSKQTGEKVNGSIINTSSEAALLGPPAQANYGAAKAGITALTVSAARGLGRIGARANAICPRARTPMTADVFGEAPEGTVDPLAPEHVVRLVNFLSSDDAENVSGQVFVVYGPQVMLMAPPTVDQVFSAEGDAWDADDLAKTLGEHFAGRDPGRIFSALDLIK
ncbi:3-oxoacyl-[acyl-carrier protein] reductase [Gordonia amarae]|uniref:Putative oxidoreductase n=1 Tax=Gordonia amarae NBRC 15530 TaxID=1075090 RepID=G7GKG0_9ACTN|nr:3-oxoacyl-[acyl-carrier protein] reductase [Gordonia amarae]GAB04085.1 putative oxidoreductase [Gordonia amarae NBRC 15530]